MRKRVMAAIVAGVLVLGACSNSESGSGDDGGGSDDSTPTDAGGEENTDEFIPSDQPGVTDDTIRVGGIASVTNPLGAPYGEVFTGAQAYFDAVNEDGGIYGREIDLVDEVDDNTGFENVAAVIRLLTESDVFAVVPVATLSFDGAQELAEEGVPTFGWNIQEDWALGDSLFGTRGHITTEGAFPTLPWIVREMGATTVGILAYDVPQSSGCATGVQNSIETFGGDDVEVGFADGALQYGQSDVSVQVAAMKDAGVDFVVTCMDFNGEKTVADEMARQDLEAPFYRPNGYDQEQLDEFPDTFEGSVVLHQFWPFAEETDRPEEMQRYIDAMADRGEDPGELSLAGWISADMFYQGLVGAGPEFTRQGVVDYLNTLEDYDAGGILAGIDWTIEHTADPDIGCNAFSLIEDGEFVPTFGEPGEPFICLDSTVTELPDQPEVRS